VEFQEVNRKTGAGDGGGAVSAALERWVSEGLLTREVADVLGRENDAFAGGIRRNTFQYLIAGTAGLLTLVAAAVLLRWSWPHLGPVGQTTLIAVAGVILVLGGMVLEPRRGRAPVGHGLQTAGLAILLMACAYSEKAWANGSPLAVASGLLVISVPLVLAPLSVGRSLVMPAVVTTLGYGYLFLFLVRAGMEGGAALWVVDGVMVLSLVVLGALALRRAAKSDPGVGTQGATPHGGPARVEAHWEMAAFTASLFASPVLILATATGPMRMGEDAVFALDVWWILLAGITLWTVHAAPPALRRSWVPNQLAWTVISGVVLAFWTILGPLNWDPWMAAGAVAGLGGAALWHGLTFDFRQSVLAGCLAMVIAALYFGAESGGAVGVAVALGFTAGLLFWVSGRLGDAVAGAEGVPS
jgi:hypothetical protein